MKYSYSLMKCTKLIKLSINDFLGEVKIIRLFPDIFTGYMSITYWWNASLVH